MSLLDFLFPKKCINCRRFGDFLCADCFAKISYNATFSCPTCLRPSIDGMVHPLCARKREIDGIMPVVSYNRIVKKLIYQLKYKPYLSKLDKTIGELMVEGLSQNESFYRFVEMFEPVVIPIPLSLKRQRERGYNHAELLASYVAQYFKLKMNPKLLVRSKETKPQYKLGREQRFANIHDAFMVRVDSRVPNAVILVDDIATTYATLKEAAKILKTADAKKVLGVTFAREA